VAIAIEQAAGDHIDDGGRWALAGGAAVYLVCLTVAQRALVRGVSRRKVVARGVSFVALVLLVLLGFSVPPVAFVSATAAVLLALVAFELWAYRRAQAAMRLAALGT
jgi:hypothetical protein